MPGYGLCFTPPVRRDLLCFLCRLPMRQPVIITDCSHSFCDSCLQQYLSEGELKCPRDKVPIDYAKIYPDLRSEADIMMSQVRCARYKEGCQWVDILQNAQAHTEVCSYDAALPCPNDCVSRLSRVEYDNHVKYTCPRRRHICELCGKEFIGDSIDLHQGNCLMEMVWCENKCGARLQRRHLANHSQSDCHKRTTRCSHCQKQFVHETLQDHYYQCPRFPMTCPNHCDPGRVAREDMEKHLSQSCSAAVVPCPFREIGCKYTCPRSSIEAHYTSAVRSHLSLTCSLAVDQQRQIDELSHRLAAVNTLHAAADGSFIWRVAGLTAKAGCEVKSGAFYTSTYGYRLRGSIFPTGNGSGEGTHLSIYIRVVPGDYDTLLDWPFRLPVSITLYDQSSDPQKRSHFVERFVPNPTWKQFQRPAKDASEGSGFGYPRFISLETLRTGSYIRDDTIFVKFRVDLSAFIERW